MHAICFITTCMGRLAHLRQSLPSTANQPGCACVVVDFSCPEASGAWVEQNHPQVKVVRVPGQPWFNLAAARNAGVRGAPETPWLGFVDADVILAADFAQRVLPLLHEGNFYVLQPWQRELTGMLLCRRADFLAAGGYDELFQGWGEEDVDLFNRLRLRGIALAGLPQDLATPILHDDAERVRHYAEKQIRVSQTINTLYRNAKYDLLRLLGRALTDVERRALYAQAGEALHNFLRDREQNVWRMHFRQEETFLGLEIVASLSYALSALAQPTNSSGVP